MPSEVRRSRHKKAPPPQKVLPNVSSSNRSRASKSKGGSSRTVAAGFSSEEEEAVESEDEEDDDEVEEISAPIATRAAVCRIKAINPIPPAPRVSALSSGADIPFDKYDATPHELIDLEPLHDKLRSWMKKINLPFTPQHVGCVKQAFVLRELSAKEIAGKYAPLLADRPRLPGCHPSEFSRPSFPESEDGQYLLSFGSDGSSLRDSYLRLLVLAQVSDFHYPPIQRPGPAELPSDPYHAMYTPTSLPRPVRPVLQDEDIYPKLIARDEWNPEELIAANSTHRVMEQQHKAGVIAENDHALQEYAVANTSWRAQMDVSDFRTNIVNQWHTRNTAYQQYCAKTRHIHGCFQQVLNSIGEYLAWTSAKRINPLDRTPSPAPPISVLPDSPSVSPERIIPAKCSCTRAADEDSVVDTNAAASDEDDEPLSRQVAKKSKRVILSPDVDVESGPPARSKSKAKGKRKASTSPAPEDQAMPARPPNDYDAEAWHKGDLPEAHQSGLIRSKFVESRGWPSSTILSPIYVSGLEPWVVLCAILPFLGYFVRGKGCKLCHKHNYECTRIRHGTGTPSDACNRCRSRHRSCIRSDTLFDWTVTDNALPFLNQSWGDVMSKTLVDIWSKMLGINFNERYDASLPTAIPGSSSAVPVAAPASGPSTATAP
ncbi:hypothetical protein C8R44DRAFT_740801 [Mycena epipterygia]|nr:hypothetical protein C8R44DRAFT_740801 [Mycena epipterygia]